jgi:hypothetical protein
LFEHSDVLQYCTVELSPESLALGRCSGADFCVEANLLPDAFT